MEKEIKLTTDVFIKLTEFGKKRIVENTWKGFYRGKEEAEAKEKKLLEDVNENIKSNNGYYKISLVDFMDKIRDTKPSMVQEDIEDSLERCLEIQSIFINQIT